MQAQSETSVTFPKTLQRLLDEQGITAAGLGKATGISHVAIGNYLKGRLPKVGELLKIAQHFGITVEEALGHSARRSGAGREVQTAPAEVIDRSRVLEESAATLLRAAREAEASATRLQSAIATFRKVLGHGTEAGLPRRAGSANHVGSKPPAFAGVSSVVASAAESGAVAALAEARRRVPESSRSPATGAPTARKPMPARGSK